MQAVILAAGQSSRFYPFTNVAHKSLITVMGKTLLEHTLIAIKKLGIEEVVLVVAKNSPIPEIIGDGKRLDIKIIYVTQPEALGMGDAVLQADAYIHDEFVLLNAYHVDISDFLHDMEKKNTKKEEIVLLGRKEEGAGRYGYIQIENGKAKHIIEKPEVNQTNALRVIGIYLLNKQFLQVLHDTPLEHYHFENALDTYMQTGHARVLETTKETLTLKYAWDVLDVKNYLLSKIKHSVSPQASVSPHSLLLGKVYIEEGATIYEGVCIKGPAYIGKNTVVGNNALVRGGVCLEENAMIGSYMEVTNSVIMQNSTSHSGFIGDSVIGSNTKIGAMFCSANVRLDRKQVSPKVKEQKVSSYKKHLGMIAGNNVIMGAGVTTMPGVIIGNDTMIGPSTTIMKNVEDHSIFYTEFKHVVKKEKKI